MPQADLAVVRRLLDESAEQRARAARELMGTVMEVLCGVALDLEVVQRQVEKDPGSSAEAFSGLGGRIAGAVDDLRALPQTELIVPLQGEPANATLRRCVERHQARLGVELAWSGAEPQGEAVRAALAWVTQEFLLAAGESGAGAAGVALSGGHETTLLTLTADSAALAPAGGVEPGWLLRCRARAAVAGGVVALDPEAAPERCTVEVRFPGTV